MKKKVYISSTMDLKPYRQKAFECFNRYPEHFEFTKLAEAMIHDTRSTIEICLGEVEQCDLYILIMGLRYGSTVPNQTVSYTHSEYLRARDTDKRREILVFYAKVGDPAFKADPEDSDAYRSQKDFRKLTRSSHTSSFDYFITPESFEMQLMRVLLKLVYDALPPVEAFAIERKCDRIRTASEYQNECTYIFDGDGSQVVFPALFYARQQDCPNEFTDRLAFTERGLDMKISLQPDQYNHSMDANRKHFNIRRLILEELGRRIPAIANDPDANRTLFKMELFLPYISRQGVKELFVEFVADDQFELNGLAETLGSFAAAIQQQGPLPIRVHMVVSIRGSNVTAPVVAKAAGNFTTHIPALFNLGMLEEVRREDIRTWMRRELKLTSDVQVDMMIDCYFAATEFSISMTEAQQKLKAMMNNYPHKKLNSTV